MSIILCPLCAAHCEEIFKKLKIGLISLFCALVLQCYNNKYIFYMSNARKSEKHNIKEKKQNNVYIRNLSFGGIQ